MYVLPRPIGHCSFAQCHAVDRLASCEFSGSLAVRLHYCHKFDSFLCLTWYCCDLVSSELNYDGTTNSYIIIFLLFGFLVY